MGGGDDVNSILNTFFFIYCSLLGDFCTENIIEKKKNYQVLNKPQMRLLLKIPGLPVPFCKSRQIYIYI